MTILLSILVVIILTSLHELGHVAVAKWYGLALQKVGFTLVPTPHVFVEVDMPKRDQEKYLFLLAGTLTTLLFCGLAYFLGWFQYLFIAFAFAFQIIVETNPFYSDFTIITGLERDEYLFSSKWYIHFMLWIGLIVWIIQQF